MPPFLCFSLPGSPVMVLCPSQIKNLLLLVLIPLAPVCCHDTPLFGIYDSIMVMPLQSAIHKVTILFLLSTRYFFHHCVGHHQLPFPNLYLTSCNRKGLLYWSFPRYQINYINFANLKVEHELDHLIYYSQSRVAWNNLCKKKGKNSVSLLTSVNLNPLSSQNHSVCAFVHVYKPQFYSSVH